MEGRLDLNDFWCCFQPNYSMFLCLHDSIDPVCLYCYILIYRYIHTYFSRYIIIYFYIYIWKVRLWGNFNIWCQLDSLISYFSVFCHEIIIALNAQSVLSSWTRVHMLLSSELRISNMPNPEHLTRPKLFYLYWRNLSRRDASREAFEEGWGKWYSILNTCGEY